MKKMMKLPGVSVLLIVSSYGLLGWLLSIHGQRWEYWIPSGALSVGISWFTAIVWAVVAIVVVFARQKLLFLSIGLCLVWAMLMYIARLELMAFLDNRRLAAVNLMAMAAMGLALGWFVDLNLIRTIGVNLLK